MSPKRIKKGKPKLKRKEEDQSKMSITLLQNFLLSLSLMKNIALKFTCDDIETFNYQFTSSLKKLRFIEHAVNTSKQEMSMSQT